MTGTSAPSLRWPVAAMWLMAVRSVNYLMLAVAALAGCLAVLANAHAEEAIWRSLREGGHVVLIRHALAPGTGDPAGFVLGDCATQRNLSAEGRAQARRIGATLAAGNVEVDRILSSRWCRALETATLMDLGPVEPFPALDSFFGNRAQSAAQTAAVKALLRGAGNRTLVMVTHQVNITALTGVFPRSGEIIVAKAGKDPTDTLRVVARIAVDR